MDLELKSLITCLIIAISESVTKCFHRFLDQALGVRIHTTAVATEGNTWRLSSQLKISSASAHNSLQPSSQRFAASRAKHDHQARWSYR